MKLILIFNLCLFVQSFAIQTYSQETTLSLNLRNVSIKKVLQEIEDHSEFYFLYNDDLVDVSRIVDIDVHESKVRDILKTLFQDDGVTYIVKDRQIILSPLDVEGNNPLTATQPVKTITGKVTDPSGESLPGVTVVIKGTTNGTVTGSDGSYNFSGLPSDAVLVFSFVGMKSQEIAVGGKSRINVTMEDETIGLEEVVAIGYGTMRKADLTGAVSSVGSNTLKDIPVTSVGQAIQGHMAGVQVTKTEGSPDAEILIRVRGGGSLTQDNSPLYIVDGFPVTSISNIAPTDIASIDVLKDASSTAIYGARGANGVILITTKGGFEGKGKVSFNTYYGVKYISKKMKVMNPYEYVLWQKESMGNTTNSLQQWGDIRDIDLYRQMTGTDWQNEVLGNTGITKYNNLAFTGGTKTSKYNISITNNDDKEILLNSGISRTNVMANFSQKLNTWLTIDLNTLYTNTKLKGNVVSNTSTYGRLASMLLYRPVPGLSDFVNADLTDPTLYEANMPYIRNPVSEANDDYRRRNTMTFSMNGAATIKFSKNLEYRFSYATRFDKDQTKFFYGVNTYQFQLDGAPAASINKVDRMNYRLANTLTYNVKDFLPGHNLTVLAGQEIFSLQGTAINTNARNFPIDIDATSALSMMQLGTAQPIVTNQNSSNNLSSFFGRLFYNYKGRYLATATIRADGTSKFAPGNQWGYFPSGGLGWRISDEKFMKFAKPVLNDLKLRSSYGAAGNNNVSENAWRKSFSVTTNNLIIGDGTPTPFLAASNILSNNKLKWETTITQNAGIDFSMFKQRLSGSVEIYHNITKDLLIRATIPSATGYSYQWQNIGQTSNKGLEVSLNGIIVQKKDFQLSASFNIGFNKNHIDKLGEAKSWEQASNWGASSGALNDYLINEGGQVGQMYGYVTDPNNHGMYSFDDFTTTYDPITNRYTYVLKPSVASDKSLIGATWFGPGTLKLVDQDNSMVLDTKDRKIIGNANPIHTGGLNLTASYKGLDLSAFFNWSYGNDVYNANKLYWTNKFQGWNYRNMLDIMNSDHRFMTIDKTTGLQVTDPAILADMNKNATIWSANYTFSPLHSWAIEDGSFLRLNTLTLGYTLPKRIVKKVGIEMLRVYATGYNLWIWTNYSGYDPEVNTMRSTGLTPGIDYSAYPKSRTFNIGLNLEF